MRYDTFTTETRRFLGIVPFRSTVAVNTHEAELERSRKEVLEAGATTGEIERSRLFHVELYELAEWAWRCRQPVFGGPSWEDFKNMYPVE